MFSIQLKHGKKMVYLGHRRFLPRYHPYIKEKKTFNRQQEFQLPPEALSREEVLTCTSKIQNVMGKNNEKRNSNGYWKKKSIIFKLDYWKNFPVRHCLNVMHIEKKCVHKYHWHIT